MPLPELNSIDVSASLSSPDVSELTSGSVDGTGVFDTMMRSAKAHLLEEYNANRISGTEYTTVYLGMMQSTMQQSVAFILNHQQKEKVSAEIGLIRQQTVTELTQTDDAIPVGLGFNDSTDVEGLIKSKKDLEAQQILSAVAQVEIANEEIDLAKTKTKLSGQQLITELAQTDNTISAEAMTYAFNGTADIEGLVATQKEKVAAEVQHVNAEISLTDQRVVTELAQTDDAASAAGLAGSQRTKTEAEITRINSENDWTVQKIVTELAQTDEVTSANGLVGSQRRKIDADTAFIAKQEDKIDAEILLTDQKTTTELAQTNDAASANGLVGSIRDKNNAEISLINQKKTTELAQTDEATSASGLVGAQKTKLTAEASLTDQKTQTELAQTDDVVSELGLAGAQKSKVSAETVLLSQKSITELAQTSDTVTVDTDALNTSATVTGITATQKDLFTAQTDGFARDAEQKLAKMLLDTWSVRMTTDGATADTAGIGDSVISAVITKAKTGINA